MNAIIRNLRTTLMRFKLSSSLNILGLAVAYCAFIIIMIQTQYEFNFDRNYQRTGDIYRVEVVSQNSISPLLSRPYLDVIVQNVAQIEQVVLTQPFSTNDYITVDNNGQKVGLSETIMPVYAGFDKLFSLNFVEGGRGDSVLRIDHRVIVPLSVAQRIFGAQGPYVGRTFVKENERKAGQTTTPTYEVEGVFEDLPKGSSPLNCIYTTFPDNENKTNWGNRNYYSYLLLTPQANPDDVAKMLNDNYKKAEKPEWEDANSSVQLTPLEDVYYLDGLIYDTAPKGDRATTNILLTIAFLVIAIAAINFVNFAMSLTPLRIKSINIQKVLGSSVVMLRMALVVEAVVISFLGFLIGVGLVDILARCGFAQYLLCPIDVVGNLTVVWYTLGLSLVVGLLSGLYPAIYSTLFPPAMVLKGSFGMSSKGRKLRSVLIGFQFVISIGLIISAMFMHIQNAYLRSQDKGFNQSQIAVVELSRDMVEQDVKLSAIIDRFKSSPLVEDVAFGLFFMGSRDNYMSWGRNLGGEQDRELNFTCMPVSSNFLDVMGIKTTEGRNFVKEDELYVGGTVIFNRKAQKAVNLTLDDKFNGHTDTTSRIVGFIEDFNYASLRQPIGPFAFYEFGPNAWSWLQYAYIKTSSDPYMAVEHIKKVIAEFDPTYPAEINFYDQVFNVLYEKERKTTNLITAFSLLAVIISLVGVFGVVVFETQYRRKEIGVRKVHGSTIGEVLVMFNKKFVYLVLFCFVVAAPLSWWAVSVWLEGFAYRTALHWWVFGAALFIVLAVTVTTVTVQSYRASTENPIRSLKSE